jgi:hypothetical protein
MQAWPHWGEVYLNCIKESPLSYEAFAQAIRTGDFSRETFDRALLASQMSHEQFDRLLPEYQKFQALCGHYREACSWRCYGSKTMVYSCSNT